MSEKVYASHDLVEVFYEALKEYGLVKLLEYRKYLTEEITKHDKYHVLEFLSLEDMENGVKYSLAPHTLEQELEFVYYELIPDLLHYQGIGDKKEELVVANEIDRIIEIYKILQRHGVIGDLGLMKYEDIKLIK